MQIFHRLPSRLTLLLLGVCLASVQAQNLELQPTPFTVLVDFSLLQNPYAPRQALPIWLETVQIVHSEVTGQPGDPIETGSAAGELNKPPYTTFRLRLRQMPGLNDSLFLRLFFNDLPNAHPTVTAWSETGNQQFASQPLGAGLGLPASESLAIPTKGVDYIEIDVPGDGSSVSRALVATLKQNNVATALDFAAAAPLSDPFGSPLPAVAAANDSFLFGRIRATLEPGTVKLAPAPSVVGLATAVAGGTSAPDAAAAPVSDTVQFEFNLEAEPLLALVTFDVLDADPAVPLQSWTNHGLASPVALQLPDLADPAYAGITRPYEKMRFYYAGWIRCQKIIPGSALHAGLNTFSLQIPKKAAPVVIRAVELQLKHHWQKLDYTLSPY